MAMTADQYAEQLLTLLPQGRAWPREGDSNLRKLMAGIGDELSRIGRRAEELLHEAIPTTTIQMLEDWERAAGLPDLCVLGDQTLQERRNALLARLVTSGGQSREFFISLGAYLGYTITITEFLPFRVGRSSVGDHICDESWRHIWRVNGPDVTIIEFRVSLSAVGEPLRKWGNELLECVFNRIKPAHTVLMFGYGATGV